MCDKLIQCNDDWSQPFGEKCYESQTWTAINLNVVTEATEILNINNLLLKSVIDEATLNTEEAKNGEVRA